MGRLHLRRLARPALCAGAALAVGSMACAQELEDSFATVASKALLVPAGETGSDMLARASVAVHHLTKMELGQASKALNEALQLDARNSYLHFFNGFIYHLQARQGDSQKVGLAIEGYQQALRLDPGNWIAQEFLGLAYLDLKQYGPAKEQFVEVLLMSPDSTVSLHGLMVAAYMTGDAATACAMADQFRAVTAALQPAPHATPHTAFLRSSIAVYASCGEFDKADAMRQAFGQLRRERRELEGVDQRLNQWKVVLGSRGAAAPAVDTPPALVPTRLDTPHGAPADRPRAIAQGFMTSTPEPAPVPPVDAPAEPPAAAASQAQASAATLSPEGAAAAGSRMVLVDVVLVSTQEQVTTAKGINLLNALTLQLGSATQAAFSRTFNSTAEPDTIITRALTVPALAYSLNIANATSTLNEVLARPTLAATEGLPSEFFSGINLNAAVVSTNSLGNASAVPVDKRFGVKLAVTPAFLPNGMVKLKVETQRTFLNANVDSAGFAYRLEISETTANANVVMKLGDTLVLSGLSEKESSSSRTGVPGLQDVPGVQYLFSTKRNSDFQRSVLVLVTPRRPVYTSRVSVGADGAVSDSMKALREKFGFSGRTPSNIESILNHLKTTNLFRDFRQGDVSLERWDRMHSTGERLRQALEFLYY